MAVLIKKTIIKSIEAEGGISGDFWDTATNDFPRLLFYNGKITIILNGGSKIILPDDVLKINAGSSSDIIPIR